MITTHLVIFSFFNGASSTAPGDIVRRSVMVHVLLNVPPGGDGTISAADRQDVASCYAGILAGTVSAAVRRSTPLFLLLNTLPAGDGVISQSDRQNASWCYAGILAGAGPTGPPGFIPEEFDNFKETF